MSLTGRELVLHLPRAERPEPGRGTTLVLACGDFELKFASMQPTLKPPIRDPFYTGRANGFMTAARAD